MNYRIKLNDLYVSLHLTITFHCHQVVLCGGSARIPKLQQMIRDIFPDVALLNSIPTDEVIPVGAAIEAGILVGRDTSSLDEDSITVDCCAKDILVKVRR